MSKLNLFRVKQLKTSKKKENGKNKHLSQLKIYHIRAKQLHLKIMTRKSPQQRNILWLTAQGYTTNCKNSQTTHTSIVLLKLANQPKQARNHTDNPQHECNFNFKLKTLNSAHSLTSGETMTNSTNGHPQNSRSYPETPKSHTNVSSIHCPWTPRRDHYPLTQQGQESSSELPKP